VPIQITLPDDLAAQIGKVTNDPSQFVAAAVRQVLRDSSPGSASEQIEQINQLADELNREAADVLEFQVIA
jgi:hypothetical protein